MWKMQRDSGGLADMGLFKYPENMQHPEKWGKYKWHKDKIKNKVTERREQTKMREVTKEGERNVFLLVCIEILIV